jgi:hypothetical protein
MIKRLLRGLLGEVAVWRIFRCDADGIPSGVSQAGVSCRSIESAEVAALRG